MLPADRVVLARQDTGRPRARLETKLARGTTREVVRVSQAEAMRPDVLRLFDGNMLRVVYLQVQDLGPGLDSHGLMICAGRPVKAAREHQRVIMHRSAKPANRTIVMVLQHVGTRIALGKPDSAAGRRAVRDGVELLQKGPNASSSPDA